MRFAVEAWPPEYRTSVEADLEPTDAPVDVSVEVDPARWEPRRPQPGPPPEAVLFVDGVQRVEARLWITDGDGAVRPGACGSYAAGVVRCAGSHARVEGVQVRRELFSAARDAQPIRTRLATYSPYTVGERPEAAPQALLQRMRDLEVLVAARLDPGERDLVVIDGHLSGRQNVPHAIGYVKTHHQSYLPPEQEGAVARLEPGERTPLFHISGSVTRFAWYMRLPGARGHPWAGVVRCEIAADRSPRDAADLADRATATLPRFASEPHKEPRAPQNLYPIAGLERDLRHRLGDQRLLYRELLAAAASARGDPVAPPGGSGSTVVATPGGPRAAPVTIPGGARAAPSGFADRSRG